MLLLIVTAALLVAGSAGSAAGARDEPTISVREGCQYLFDGLYGGWIDVAGLKPNTEYVFSYGPGLGAAYFTTDDAGAYPAVGGGEHTEPFELNVQVLLDPNHNLGDGDDSVVLEEHIAFTRPCTDFPSPFPATKEDCKHGGWREFDFESKRECIRFVKRQARQYCRGERDVIGREAFREKYGRGKHHRRAMRRCIKQTIGAS
jgi:hypothetical protein